MKSIKLTIRGVVQKVGYRNQVFHIARRLKLKGYVKNLDDSEESVEVLAQHTEPPILDEFVKKIKINDGFIEVEEIIKEEVSEEPRVKFELVRGSPEEENIERLDTAAYHLNALRGETHGGFASLSKETQEGFASLHEDNQQVITRLDSMDSKLDSFSSNTSSRFDTVDHKYGKISEQLEEISVSLNKLVSILERFVPEK